MADNRRAWTGWIVFAGVMLLVTGLFNIVEGFVALVYDERIVIDGGNLVVVDLTGWGWALLVSGVILVLAGIGLMSAKSWARYTAIVVVALHAVSQVAWLGAYPIWSLLMIALDTVVLFALTARWSGVGDELDPYGATAAPAASETRSGAPYGAVYERDRPTAVQSNRSDEAVSQPGARHVAG